MFFTVVIAIAHYLKQPRIVGLSGTRKVSKLAIDSLRKCFNDLIGKVLVSYDSRRIDWCTP
jgi:hypothetical protein